MAKNKKFEKLEVNEDYYKTHTDEEKPVQKHKQKKNKGMFFDIDSKKVPEKQRVSKTFTYTKEKRKTAYENADRGELEPPAKAPFVLMLVVVLLCLAAFFITSSKAFLSMPQRNISIAKMCLMAGIYLVPTVVYIVSSYDRRRLYNIRPFSFSMLSTALVTLGLVMTLTALQKYYITYTFGYNVSVSTPSQSVFLSIMVGAALPAICEELFVRGVLQYEISRYAGGLGGVLFCGLVFAIIHFDLQYFTVYLVAGLVLSALTHITHSVFPAMLVHFLNNTISILFSDKMSYIALRRVGGTLFMIILACLAFLFLIFLLRQAEIISSKRASELAFGESKDRDEETAETANASKLRYDEARFFISPKGRQAERLAKTFSSPFVIAAVVIFIIVVVIKQSM